MASASVSTGFHTTVAGMASVPSSVAAIDRDWATTWLTTSSPYRPWLPVRNQTSAGADGLVMGDSFGGPLAVDVLVAVVEAVDVALVQRCGAPSCRAMWTVRATSSSITAALTADRASVPIVNGPWPAMRTPLLRLPRRVSTMPRPIESSPMRANGPTGTSPPNSSAIMVRTHGIGSDRAAHAVA